VSNSNTRAWVDTVTDLNQYKPSQEELEQRKLARKSNNKLLAKVALSDRRVASLDPEKQRLIEQQILLEQRQQPGQQNVEAILARSEQVMEICQGILNGEMITPSYTSTEPGLDPAAAPDGAAAVAVTKEVAAVAVASAAAAAAPPPPPEVEVKAGKEAGGGSGSPEAPVSPPHHVTPYMNSAALNEIAGELLITVRELREELLQEREARERLEREVVQQRELLSELAREVVRLQIFCSGAEKRPDGGQEDCQLSERLETTKIV